MHKVIGSLLLACLLFLAPATAQAHHKDGHEQGPSAHAQAEQDKDETVEPTQQPAAATAEKGGANNEGPYDSTPSNGENQGNGNAPANGTVGNADDKNPPGQVNNDKDNGYECDNNKGVGDKGGNPAHTGCAETPPAKPPTKPPVDKPPVTKPPKQQPPKAKPPVVTPPVVEPPVVTPPSEPPVFVPPVKPEPPTDVDEPVDTPDELAYTGSNAAGLLLGASSLIGAGAAALRRRK